MRHSAILAALLLSVLPATAYAGEVSGTVYDSRGLSVAGVAVAVEELGLETRTGNDGSYRLPDVAAGEHAIAIALEGGAIQRVFVEVAEDGPSRRNIFLLSSASMRGVQDFASAPQTEDAPAAGIVRLPQLVGGAVAWRWRDSDA